MSAGAGASRGPLLLVVLDGFGLGDGGAWDATARAHTPFFDAARQRYPNARLETSGEAVGLPPGQMGNSEVGHMTMGAGRVVVQDMPRISRALSNGGLADNPAFRDCLEALQQSGGRLHLLGLLSEGGVHSHSDHLYAILDVCRAADVRCAVHVFLDGRDTPPKSGLACVRALLPHVEHAGGCIASISGRYFAMDRDQRWDRIARAYDILVCRKGLTAPDAPQAVEAAYARGETDEFVQPTAVADGPALRDGDAALFFNFRADRARQLTNALTGVDPESLGEPLRCSDRPKLARFVCFTEYDARYGLPVAFASERARRTLGEILADAGLAQLRLAETEKYAHVTFFFNNGREGPFPGEERLLIPSPRDVPTYDQRPEMSAQPLTDALIERLRSNAHAFTLVNFANPDMVGHTGVMPAAIQAVETLDACLARLEAEIQARGGQALVTADHGNCELMRDPQTGAPHTAHTTNPVPLFWLTQQARGRTLRDGGLADLAPTLLDLLGLPVPAEMTGRSLIV